MPHKGKLATWNDDKGFGFIEPNDGGPRVFVHIKAFKSRSRRPIQGDVVSYETAKDNQGRTNAVNATLGGGKAKRRSGPKGRAPAIMFSLLFLGALGYLTYIGILHPYLLYWYLGASLVAYAAYANDKSAAQSGRWRTKEATLQLIGLVGGWPGALIAQESLRHKSRKMSFQVVFAISVVLNGVALVWLHTADGQIFLRKLLSLIRQLLSTI